MTAMQEKQAQPRTPCRVNAFWRDDQGKMRYIEFAGWQSGVLIGIDSPRHLPIEAVELAGSDISLRPPEYRNAIPSPYEGLLPGSITVVDEPSRNKWLIPVLLALAAFGLAWLFSFATAPAHAGERWRASQAQGLTPPCDHVCEWVRDLKVPGTKKDGNPGQSCCGEADRYEADDFERDGDQYVAIVTDGHGVVPDGTRLLVSNDRVNWRDGNPTGRGQIFLSGKHDDGSYFVYCYVPPSGV